MTATIPETPETLSDLAERIAAFDDVLGVDVCADPDEGECQWLEVWADSLVVPPSVLSELVRGPFSIENVDHRQQYTRTIIVEVPE